MNELTTKRKYKWKGNKKQRDFMQEWLSPESDTFGNAYKSAVKVGFGNSYALHIVSTSPKWLSEYMQKVDLQPEHIKQGITKIATGKIDSRSVDDTRLKAYETLARIAGMIDNKNGVTVNVVQPILGGASVSPVKTDIIDIEPTKAKQEQAS